MGFADSAKAKQLADALARSKEATRRTSSASTENSQLTSSPPTVYRLGPMNIPRDLAGMTKLVHSELQKIEQSQSVILSIAQKMDEMKAASVETINGVGPDDAGNIDIGGEWEQITKTLEGESVPGYQLNDIFVGTVPSNGNLVIAMASGTVIRSDGTSFNIEASADIWLTPQGYNRTAHQFESNEDTAFIQSAPWQDWSGGAGTNMVNTGFPIWMDGDSNNATYFRRCQVPGQYNYAQWVMYNGAVEYTLEMQDNGTLFWNGRVMSTRQEIESLMNMSIALAREELKAEIYAELLALNPGIVIPQQ